MSSNSPKVTYEVQTALHEVGTAPNPLRALEAYRKRIDILKDWRVIYAGDDDRGPFKLRRNQFSDKGFVSTAFRGQSLWVLDENSASSTGQIHYHAGMGTFVDSNAASFIKSLAYREEPQAPLLQIGRSLTESFDRDELARLNPYLYLWESQREWTPKTRASCRQSVAALHALSLDKAPLDEDWGKRFRKSQREQAEAFADALLAEFQTDLDNGLSAGIEEQVDIVEAMLVRTKIIEVSSQKSSRYKMEELVRFMHEELATLMLPELIACADILCRSGLSSLSKKLNSLQNHPDPSALLTNCAWDLFLRRALDALANTSMEPSVDFYVANLITFDADVADIMKLTQLRAAAMHRRSSITFPFFHEELTGWLETRVGDKRMPDLEGIFQQEAFNSRARQRSVTRIREVLAADRAQLLELLKSKRP